MFKATATDTINGKDVLITNVTLADALDIILTVGKLTEGMSAKGHTKAHYQRIGDAIVIRYEGRVLPGGKILYDRTFKITEE